VESTDAILVTGGTGMVGTQLVEQLRARGFSHLLALVVQLRGKAAKYRGELLNLLEQAGIETRPIVTGNLARQPAASLLGDVDPASFPGAEVIHNEGFYMGLDPRFDDTMFERMLRTLDSSLSKVAGSAPLKKAG